MIKKIFTSWEDRVSNALDVINKASKKQKIEREHTADGKKLKIGMQVYHLDDPVKPWRIFDLLSESDGSKNGKVTLIQDQGTITKVSTKIYVSQLKAAKAATLYIYNEVAIIKRDAKERIDRLEPQNKLKVLEKLLKKIGKNKK